jgi:hypothetical protein
MLNMRNSTIMMFILGAALTRWIPHPPNATAIGAMALFAGFQSTSLLVALALPLAALFLGDLMMGFHETMMFTYLGFGLVVGLSYFSKRILQQSFVKKGLSVISMALLGSLIFFVVSNVGVWLTSSMYTHDLKGLAECFVMALPFLDNQVVGDLVYTGLLMGSFEYLSVKNPQVFLTQKI